MTLDEKTIVMSRVLLFLSGILVENAGAGVFAFICAGVVTVALIFIPVKEKDK